MEQPPYRKTHLDELDRVPLEHGAWRPVRRTLGVTAFGADHGTIHYALACFAARAGRCPQALEHLRVAFANDPRTREWAADDGDLDSIRDDPGYPG